MSHWELLDGDELLALARVDVESRRLDAAFVKLKKALELPDFPVEVHSVLAKLYAQLQLFQKADRHYSAYLAIHSDASLERFQWGMVQYEQGQHGSAIHQWGLVLETQPTHPPALFFSARVAAQDNNESEARRLLDLLLKSAPVDNLYFQRGKSLLQRLDAEGAKAASADTSSQLSEQLYN